MYELQASLENTLTICEINTRNSYRIVFVTCIRGNILPQEPMHKITPADRDAAESCSISCQPMTDSKQPIQVSNLQRTSIASQILYTLHDSRQARPESCELTCSLLRFHPILQTDHLTITSDHRCPSPAATIERTDQ